MQSNNRSLVKGPRKFVAWAAGAALMGISLTAAAGRTDNLVNQVEYPGFLMVQMPDTSVTGSPITNFIAQQNSPCAAVPANSIDTLKIWQSLAQSALLAGKNVTLYYNTCSGNSNKYITDIVIIR